MLTITDLAQRYGISRQQLYVRLGATDVKPMKRGNRSFFAPEQVEELDRVDALLKEGFSLNDIGGQTSDVRQMTVDIQATPITNSPEVCGANGFELLADAIASAVNQVSAVPTHNPLRNHELLSKAADEQWTLSSKQVAECCGVSSSTTNGWKSSVVRCGHRLERSGTGLWRIYREA
ncbi:MerR family transcriptional regulator [Synechococcus sp. WH 8016]|uniref:helix-turn-helix domain-containing protein n=1 Tax=Synechococcus sp. WH 8016 TaxID=166318 RepID=UPI00022DA182|nr:MerR family transcriptional regulator [Synechococcus sp. WH 8016]EHA64068.1 hypothetical protein Syn8016DRAFT_1110 [Synechococcus sp. WH 8016]